MSLPIQLQSPSMREAITDTIYRVVASYDRADIKLFESSLTQDVTVTILGQTMEGIAEIRNNSFDRVSKLDTSHHISNVRIDVGEGATTARASANAIAYHWRTGQGKDPDATRFISGGIYDLDPVLDNGLWKIRRWDLNVIWTDGDYSVMGL